MKRYAKYTICLAALALGCKPEVLAVDECTARGRAGKCISNNDASSGEPASDAADDSAAGPASDATADSVIQPSAGIAIDNLGEDGWLQSKTRFCPEHKQDVSSVSVWSDSRGVFVRSASWNPGGGPCSGTSTDDPNQIVFHTGDCDIKTVYFNNGSKWSKIYDSRTMGVLPPQMTGFDNGNLVFFGTEDADVGYSLAYLENGKIRIEPLSVFVNDVFVVNDKLAYGASDSDLISFDGVSWGMLIPVPPQDKGFGVMWANDETLFVASGAYMMSLNNGKWTVHDTRTTEGFSALWGFASDDVWAATQKKLHHYDGDKWTAVDWPFEPDSTCENSGSTSPWAVQSMWGADGVLYLISDPGRLARYQDGKFDLLLDLPCVSDSAALTEGVRILSLWGNAKDQVFIAIEDKSLSQDPCGSLRMLYFDGKQFHWF